MTSRERRVSTRVRGLELNLLERCGLSNAQVVRYALKKYMEERPLNNSHIILTEIAFLRDKIKEYELLIRSCELSIDEKIEELEHLEDYEDGVKYSNIVSLMYDRYLEFIDDDGLTDEFRCDLGNFYSYCSDAINIIAMKNNKSYEECIDYFEEYLESILKDNVFVDEKGVSSSS